MSTLPLTCGQGGVYMGHCYYCYLGLWFRVRVVVRVVVRVGVRVGVRFIYECGLLSP